MNLLEIPNHLFNEIRQGRVVLFLGSGASRGAINNKNEEPPIGNKLSEIIADHFLGGRYRDQSLMWVSELASSESSVLKVQEFIRELFLDFKPADFHYLIPTFRWRGIISTNYDLIIEQVYNNTKGQLQKLIPLLSNRDRIDEFIRSKNDLPYLKIHGCISRINDPDLPLILTTEQYVTHKKSRDRLFKTFNDWGYE